MNYFESPAQEKYGITCSEALKRGLIGRGSYFNFRTGKLIQDGWECRANGANYPTQFKALEAHFNCIANDEAERDVESNRKLALFDRYKDYIKSNGFLTENLRIARSKVFDWDDLILSKRDEGEFTEDEADRIIDAYGGMIIKLKFCKAA